MLEKIISHRKLYYAGLFLMAVGLPTSNFLMSVSSIWLGANWLLEGKWKEKLQRLVKNKAALVLCSFYLLHIIGLLYTTDFDYAFRDIKIKLPLFVVPFVLGSITPLSARTVKQLLFFNVGATLVGTFMSYAIIWGWTAREVTDIRDAIPFISHIRFSLITAVSIFILVHYFTRDQLWQKALYLAVIGWFLVFLYVIKSPTGVAVVVGGLTVYLLYHVFQVRHRVLKLVTLLLLVAVPLSAVLYVRHCINDYYTLNTIDLNDLEHLERHTSLGNPYGHYIEEQQIQDGNYVYTYIQWGELEAAWNKRSTINYDSLDHRGQRIYGTIVRYMTSKGLRKDDAGVQQLTDEDIKAIEAGEVSALTDSKSGLRARMDQIIFEFNHYLNGSNPSGNSVTQKLEFWKAGIAIIAQNFWVGVGTGDVQLAFDEQYEKMNSKLSEGSRKRAHNQYLTFFITFGTIGIVWFLLNLFYPMFATGRYAHSLYLMFLMALLMSFITEDTLETQAGITFYVFYNSLLLFHQDNTSS